MPTLVLDPAPKAFEELLERRRQWGADRRDEVWEGVLRMVPPASDRHSGIALQVNALLRELGKTAGLRARAEFGIGHKDDYRVPDGGLVEPTPADVYRDTAALVVEVLSPGDDAWRKLEFYAAHRVDELVIVDPDKRTVDWLALADGSYQAAERSGIIALGPAELGDQIDWDG